ncbi:MAG: hypothetical protein IJ856_04775 [Candidatus Methanomethylophilaceae archaeon]|nr:hypothetical protein [Candidatus Methanomethylophilaceae archaeon]
MMQRKSQLLVLVTVLIVVIALTTFFAIRDSDSDASSRDVSNLAKECDIGTVLLLSSDYEVGVVIGDILPNAIVSDSSVGESDVTVMDGSWMKTVGTKAAGEEISKSVASGVPVMVLDIADSGLGDVVRTSVEIGCEGAVSKAFYRDASGIGYTYSVRGIDVYGSIPYLLLWCDAIVEDDRVESLKRSSWISQDQSRMPAQLSLDDNGAEIISYETVTDVSLFGRGTTTLTSCISRLTNILDPNKDYYTIHYYHSGAPDAANGIRLDELDLHTMVSTGTMHYAGPNTTQGSSTTNASVNLGASAGYSGGPYAVGNFDSSYNWSYTIPDVVLVTTFTSSSGNTDHDVDESKAVGNGFTGEPGILFSGYVNDGYVHLVAHSFMYTYEKHSFLFWNTYEDRLQDWFSVDIWIWGDMASVDKIILY